MISNKYSIREQNEAIILRTIIERETVSRTELATITGLNKASVSSITKKLMEDDLVLETGIGDASLIGGRKPILLAFNPRSALAISVDLGYNYVKALLSYLDGEEVLAISKRRITLNSENVVSLLKDIIESLEFHQAPTRHGIIGVTIAIHGVVFNNASVFTPYYDLDQVNLPVELATYFNYPILIDNEANLTAIGEYTYSSNFDSLVSLSIHSGIGAGIVADGKIQLGKHGKSGEIGHSILYPNGRPCPCGNHGCLEQYTSNKVVYAEVARLKGLDYVNSAIIRDLYYQNDPEVVALIDDNCALLSIGINNIVTIYDPEIVIINSSLYREIPEMVEKVKLHMMSHFSNEVVIHNSLLKDRATLYGALAVTAQNFLNVQKLRMNQSAIKRT